MKKHFNRKTPCRNTHNVNLTEEIKDYVYEHKVYHPPAPSNPKQVVNNYNFLANFISKMDYDEKLEHVLGYQQQRLIDFEDGLDQRFERKLDRLDKNDYKQPYELTEKDLFGLINDVTKINSDQLNYLNVLFDKKVNRILFYSCEKWDSSIVEYGIADLVRYLQSYFLDTYEKYLIKNIHGDKFGAQARSSLKNHLEIYYRFLISVGLRSNLYGNTDEDILGRTQHENSPYSLEEYYMKWFDELKKLVKQSDKNSVKKQIINILKENSVHNIQELNKSVLSIIQVDQTFREKVLQMDSKRLAEL
jgi:hypothetical protein